MAGLKGVTILPSKSANFIVQISSAIFDCSAPDLGACPDESLPEFAFIGRSNVGKSSLLNMLSGRDGLARVSPVPGFTKLINFFTINRTWRLVDLPGYGYAQLSRKHSSRFNKATAYYLTRRPNLSCVFVLIDSGLKPQENDVEFVEWLARHAVPFVLVFTKADKLSADKVQANIKAFTDRIATWFVQLPAVFTCSSQTGAGRQELLGVIEETLTAIRAQSAPDQPTKESPADDVSAAGHKPKPKTAGKKRPDLARPW